MDYLKVWTSFREVIAPLNDSEKGRLFDAMLTYAETGKEPSDFKGNERFLWPAAKQDIDRTAQKADQLRKNGSAGGLQKARNQSMANYSNGKQNVANDSKSYQSETNDSYKEKKSNSNIKKDNIKETPLTGSKEKAQSRFSPPTVDEVRAYCQERGNSVNPERFVDFYAAKGWRVGNQPMKDWKACVRTWEQRDSGNGGKVRQMPGASVPAQNYEQRSYDEPSESLEEVMRRVGAL